MLPVRRSTMPPGVFSNQVSGIPLIGRRGVTTIGASEFFDRCDRLSARDFLTVARLVAGLGGCASDTARQIVGSKRVFEFPPGAVPAQPGSPFCDIPQLVPVEVSEFECERVLAKRRCNVLA